VPAVTSRRLPALLFFAAGALLLVGCGDSASGTSASGATTTTAKDTFRSCLSRHGVDLPAFGQRGQRPGGGTSPGPADAGGSTPDAAAAGGSAPDVAAGRTGGGGQFSRRLPDGVDPTQFRRAMDACRSLRPAGGFGAGRGRRFDAGAFAAYRSCMQDHGVTLPTGGFGRGGGGRSPSGPTTSLPATPPTTIDRTSPVFRAADQACAALRPAPSGSTTTTTARG
jgi:hypothetical protein